MFSILIECYCTVVVLVYLCCLSAHFDTKGMHVESKITEKFKKTYHAKSTLEFDLRSYKCDFQNYLQ